jgi:DNA-binding transcriptional MerR regulator
MHSRLTFYQGLAPFSIEELVDAANSVLQHRPRLKVTRRTVRYYVQEGVLPPPAGSPKFARYGYDHLLRIVGARCLQDLGSSLGTVRETLDRDLRGDVAADTAAVEGWLAMRPGHGVRPQGHMDVASHLAPSALSPDSSEAFANRSSSRSPEARSAFVLQLTPHSSLTVTGPHDLQEELRAAAEAIEQFLRDTS